MTPLDFGAIAEAKARARGDLVRAVAGMPADEPESVPEQTSQVPGFDGGARRDQPTPAPSHGETLLDLIRTRRADAGAWFG